MQLCDANVDSTQKRVQIVSYFTIVPFVTLSGLLWGILNSATGRHFNSIPPYTYAVLGTLVTMLLWHKKIEPTVASLIMMVALALLPATMHVIQGGFAGSGAVMNWTVVATPLSAILLQSRSALFQFFLIAAFLFALGTVMARVLVAQSAEYRAFVAQEEFAQFSAIQLVFFVLDLIVPSIILLGSLLYYELRIAREEARARALLNDILPRSIVDKMQRGVARSELAQTHKNVTLFFSDIVGFTEMSGKVEPHEMIKVLDALFTRMDEMAVEEGVYKVETIGDAYFCVCGLPEPVEPREAAQRIGRFALRVRQLMRDVTAKHGVHMRIGLHSGDVVTGKPANAPDDLDACNSPPKKYARCDGQSPPALQLGGRRCQPCLADGIDGLARPHSMLKEHARAACTAARFSAQKTLAGDRGQRQGQDDDVLARAEQQRRCHRNAQAAQAGLAPLQATRPVNSQINSRLQKLQFSLPKGLARAANSTFR